VVKIRVNPEDSEASEKLAREFGVTGYPSFFMYPQNGRPVRVRQHKQIDGEWALMSPDEFVKACQNAAAGKAQDAAE
jgi:thioredoxin-related protein